MARPGVYKWDVEKARNTLLAQGKHPSIDAVRLALGNTGSRSTIHRYLKEIEAGDGSGPGGAVAVSDALQTLVAQLAERLHGEADARVAAAKLEHDAALAAQREAHASLQRERAVLAGDFERTMAELHAERTAHTNARDALRQAHERVAQLEERLAAANTRIGDRDAQIASLERKHEQSREALEHFRSAAKEQREADARRHEHALQGLQQELRAAAELIAVKTQELLTLNRDNGRLSEQHQQLERDLRTLRSQLAVAQDRAKDYDELTRAHQSVEARLTQVLTERAQLEEQLAARGLELERERRGHEEARALHGRLEQRLADVDRQLSELRVRSRPKSRAVPS